MRAPTELGSFFPSSFSASSFSAARSFVSKRVGVRAAACSLVSKRVGVWGAMMLSKTAFCVFCVVERPDALAVCESSASDNPWTTLLRSSTIKLAASVAVRPVLVRDFPAKSVVTSKSLLLPVSSGSSLDRLVSLLATSETDRLPFTTNLREDEVEIPRVLVAVATLFDKLLTLFCAQAKFSPLPKKQA